jgi:hypothetical protein
MGIASILSGLGSQAAGEYVLKRTRKYFADRKAKKAKTTKAKAEKAADTYQPPSEPKPKKKPKKKEGFARHGSNIGTSIRNRRRAQEESLK